MRMSKASLISMPAPSSPSSRKVVLTSCRRGTLVTLRTSSDSNAAQRIGSTAFLAPEMRTSPWSALPPWTSIFCMSGARLAGCQGLQCKRMDFAAHALAERRIHHAMTRQRQLAAERLAHHRRLEMDAVGALNVSPRPRQALFDQL